MTLLQTPFYTSAKEQNAKFAPFAGYEMPVQYTLGIMREHEWTRTRCGIFDVSHMGQVHLEGTGATNLLEKLTPSAFKTLPIGKCRYTVLLNDNGGIIDDLIVTKQAEDKFFLVLNGSRKHTGIAHIEKHLSTDCQLKYEGDDAPFVAVQGPYAESVISDVLFGGKAITDLPFMWGKTVRVLGEDIFISRTGYTGEDGFELAFKNGSQKALTIWKMLCAHSDAEPVGLGARDSLRLEMGFPLYGNDLDETTSPAEADISFILRKKNQNFLGCERICDETTNGIKRKRVGILLEDKGIAREGSVIYNTEGKELGKLTSGGFSPTTKQSIGQGYVDIAYAEKGKRVMVEVRNRRIPARIHDLAFVNPKQLKPGA